MTGGGDTVLHIVASAGDAPVLEFLHPGWRTSKMCELDVVAAAGRPLGEP